MGLKEIAAMHAMVYLKSGADVLHAICQFGLYVIEIPKHYASIHIRAEIAYRPRSTAWDSLCQ